MSNRELHEDSFSQEESGSSSGKNVFPRFSTDYQVLNLVHDSGMGRIFKALHVPSGQIVILKTLLRQKKESLDSTLKRFEREAKALARFDHPNIVAILDYRLDGEHPFIAMEYIQGITLRDYMDRFPGGMPLNRFYLIMSQLCDAVNLIHDHGIIHRDLKPKNMMVRRGPDGRPQLKVLDFGLILFDRLAFPDGGQGLTLKSEIIGAPAYMSPEQCKGESVKHLTDIYNIGLIAYELLSGKHPFNGRNLNEIILQQVQTRPLPLNVVRPEVPSHISAAIGRALEKDPEKRYFSTKALWLALNGTKSGSP